MEEFNIDVNTDMDEAYLWLEEQLFKGYEFVIQYDGYKRMTYQSSCINNFLNRYKCVLKGYRVDYKLGKIYIQPNRTNSSYGKKEYKLLQNTYSEEYYLEDCGGYETYSVSQGMALDNRLLAVYNIISPNPKDKILDVGCGRGELSFHLSKKARYVKAVDYSEEAIIIANRHFKRDNLSYECLDILLLDEEEKYDKIVLADVFEHIEDKQINILLNKLSKILTPMGKLIIHTSPNLEYYDKMYPIIRNKNKCKGIYLPINPRSYYEQLMHINEQSPFSLYNTVKKYFYNVMVWEGLLVDADKINFYEDMVHQNDLWCVASASSLINWLEGYFSKPINTSSSLNILIKSNSSISDKFFERESYVWLQVENMGNITINSNPPYPVMLSYHIFDKKGNCVLYDGARTPLYGCLFPGEVMEIFVHLDFMDIPNGIYDIEFSLVQEGVRWFDRRSENITYIKEISLN